MAITVVVILLAFLQLTSGSVQRPSLQPCSGNGGNSIAEIRNLSVTDLKPGRTVTFNYTLELKDELRQNSRVKFSLKTGSITVPCIRGLGSCTYNLCGGREKTAKEIGKPWQNKCPASPGIYNNTVKVRLPAILKIFITDPRIHVKIEAVNNNRLLLCVQFDLEIQK